MPKPVRTLPKVLINFVELDEHRKRMGWTKDDMAYEIGLKYMQLWKLETGKALPSNATIARLIVLGQGTLRFLWIDD